MEIEQEKEKQVSEESFSFHMIFITSVQVGFKTHQIFSTFSFPQNYN